MQLLSLLLLLKSLHKSLPKDVHVEHGDDKGEPPHYVKDELLVGIEHVQSRPQIEAVDPFANHRVFGRTKVVRVGVGQWTVASPCCWRGHCGHFGGSAGGSCGCGHNQNSSGAMRQTGSCTAFLEQQICRLLIKTVEGIRRLEVPCCLWSLKLCKKCR